jgi:hypothetical protein
VRPLADWSRLVAAHREQGIFIDQKTAATRWRGETMDLGLGIEVLLQQAKRARDVSAETREVRMPIDPSSGGRG